jgi:hypothetical protein
MAAGNDSPFYSNPYFSRIFLTIVIQIAAKANKLEIEPTKEKMIQLLRFANKNFVNDAFKILENGGDDKYSGMGNMKEFLATPNEIQKFKQIYYTSNCYIN